MEVRVIGVGGRPALRGKFRGSRGEDWNRRSVTGRMRLGVGGVEKLSFGIGCVSRVGVMIVSPNLLEGRRGSAAGLMNDAVAGPGSIAVSCLVCTGRAAVENARP